MEEVISFLYHAAGAILFCLALSILIMIGTAEEHIIKDISQKQAQHVEYEQED